MSFWSQLTVKITDLECFKQSCIKHQVECRENEDSHFTMQNMPVKAILQDQKGRSQAYLIGEKGAFRLVIDNDVRYSSLTGRLGVNGGLLMRDYTTSVVAKGVRRAGGMVNSTQVREDGSVLLRVSTL